MRCIQVFLSLLILIGVSNASHLYSKVQFSFSSPEELKVLSKNNYPIDDLLITSQSTAELILKAADVAALKGLGLSYNVVIEDMEKEYLTKVSNDRYNASGDMEILRDNSISAYPYGSMNGYHLVDELKPLLDSLHAAYPELMSPVKSIGKTTEKRDIWSYKLSDNVQTDESAVEKAAYYDAMHHAREMNSMPALIFFTIWLLENYDSDPVARHILNNRELFIVPMVNPDGVAFNELNSPSGGGMWRKNKRINGDFSFGVDLNRNYSFGYGLDNGSSGNGNSETYRGPEEFSEPETQAVRDFIEEIDPITANVIHTKAARYLIPYTYSDETPEYNTYAELTIGAAEGNNYIYGNCKQILDYYSSGTTIDYLHSEGIYCWLPELRGNDFWAPKSEILPVAAENLAFNRMIALAAGSYPQFHSFQLESKHEEGKPEISLSLAVKNRGFGEESKDVKVKVKSLVEGVVFESDELLIREITARESMDVLCTLIYESMTTRPDIISLEVEVMEMGTTLSTDTLTFVSGAVEVLFEDGGEEGFDNWMCDKSWDTTSLTFANGSVGFTDSRNTNNPENFNATIEMKEAISLSGANFPMLSFFAKWSTEELYDGTQLLISVDGGSFQPVKTQHLGTFDGRQGYTGSQDWVHEYLNLTPYIGANVRFAFRSITNYKTSGDGFFFDDFQIEDFTDFETSVSAKGAVADKGVELSLHNRVLHLSMSDVATESATVKVQDLKGRTLLTHNIPVSNRTCSVSIDVGKALSAGVYLVNISAGETRGVYPLVLK